MIGELISLIRSTELDNAQANQLEKAQQPRAPHNHKGNKRQQQKPGNQGSRMPPQPQAPMAPAPRANYSTMSPSERYQMAARRLIPAVTENNPHLKDQVGQCIYDFVVATVGQDLAPKITGMLIALPCSEIRHFMNSYENLQAKAAEAREHLLKTLEK